MSFYLKDIALHCFILILLQGVAESHVHGRHFIVLYVINISLC